MNCWRFVHSTDGGSFYIVCDTTPGYIFCHYSFMSPLSRLKFQFYLLRVTLCCKSPIRLLSIDNLRKLAKMNRSLAWKKLCQFRMEMLHRSIRRNTLIVIWMHCNNFKVAISFSHFQQHKSNVRVHHRKFVTLPNIFCARRTNEIQPKSTITPHFQRFSVPSTLQTLYGR